MPAPRPPTSATDPGASPLTIAIVEDQPRTRDGLVALLNGHGGEGPGDTSSAVRDIRALRAFHVVGAFGSMEEALPQLLERPPALLLADIGLPGMTGIEGVRRLRARHPDCLVMMLTVFADNERVFEALCAGASGYVLKDTPPDALIAALHELAAGGAPMTPEIARRVVTMFRTIAPPPRSDHRLTPRELEVLQALADGHSYKTAAHALALAVDTIRFHVRSIYSKLHVHSKSEAVMAALRRKIVR